MNDKEIQELIEVLRTSQNELSRLIAARRLGTIALSNSAAIAALVELLHTSQDDKIRWEAAESLGKIAPGDRSAIQALIELIDTSEYELTRRQAVESLGKIVVGGDRSAIAALTKLLGTSQNELTCAQAAESLGKIDPGNQTAMVALTKLLDASENEETRTQAAYSLGNIAPAGHPSAIAALVKLLDTSQDEDTLRLAAESLEKIDPGNSTAIVALVELLHKSKDESIRREAAESLGKIDPSNPTAIEALESIRREAAESLGKIDPATIAAVVELLRTSENKYIRSKAPESPTTIEALIEILDTSRTKNVPRLAAESLVKTARGNSTAIAALIKLLNPSKDEFIRRLSVQLLGKIAPSNPSAIRALAQLLDTSHNELTRRLAAETLGKIDTGNPIAIAALVELLDTSHNELIHWQAAESLSKIALPGDQTAISALVKLLEATEDDYTRWQAAESLEKIALTADQNAIAALVELLGNSQNDDARIQAAESLGKIDPGNKTAIATLIELLGNSRQSISTRRQSQKALEHIGLGNPTAIESLRELLHITRSEYTRFLVEEILNKIAPDWQPPEAEDELLLFLQVSRVKETADRYLNLNYREKTKFCYHRIIACLDRLQEGRDILSRRSLIASYIEIYQRIVAFAVKKRDYKAAFFYAEILRNRYLVERLAQQDAPLPKTVGQELAAEVREAKQAERKRLQAYTDGIGNGWDEERLRELSDAWDKAKENLEEKYARVAQSEPEFVAKTKICPISFAEVQQLLPAYTAILEYFFTGEQLLLILILPGADEPLVPKELCSRQSRPGSELEEVARAWVADLSSEDKSKQKTESEKASQDVADRIDRISALLQFQNLGQHLGDEIKHLIVVPNSYLHLFPIHALWLSDRDRVLDRFSVSYFPNLNVWKICQQRRRRQSRFIGIANPSQDKDLIFAQAEVAAIGQSCSFLEEAKLLQDREISSSAIIQAAANYNIFHFSGHAEYNFQQPLESYLMLSDNGAENLKLSTILPSCKCPRQTW